jgi:hypothetical protein
MTFGETLISVWQQSLAEGKEKVDLGDKHYPVRLFRAKKLRTVDFSHGEMCIIGIEQNPATESRWAALAEEGKKSCSSAAGAVMWPMFVKATCCDIRHGKLWRSRSDAAFKRDHLFTGG